MKVEYIGEGKILEQTNLFNKRIEKLMKNSEPTEEVPIQKTRKLREKGKGIFPLFPENKDIFEFSYKKKKFT